MHTLRFLIVSLVVGFTGTACAEPLLHNPAAPQGLEHKHDYNTVDLSTLNDWEKTFVPEVRKEPILRYILAGVDWQLRKDKTQDPYCEEVLPKLVAWEGVKIVEPIIRTNSYGDPAFSKWHEQCPGFFPHESTVTSPGVPYRQHFTTHHFKVYPYSPEPKNDDLFLFFSRGGGSSRYIDGYGNEKKKAKYLTKASGDFRVTDITACQNIGYSWAVAKEFGSYPKIPPVPPTAIDRKVSESAVLQIDDNYVAVGTELVSIKTGNIWLIKVDQTGISSRITECFYH